MHKSNRNLKPARA